MTAGKGSIINVSCKQNINTRTSTEVDLVGGDDAIAPLICTDNFLKSQDNKSAILLEKNGHESARKHLLFLHHGYAAQR
jgi:hypothetical protein